MSTQPSRSAGTHQTRWDSALSDSAHASREQTGAAMVVPLARSLAILGAFTPQLKDSMAIVPPVLSPEIPSILRKASNAIMFLH